MPLPLVFLTTWLVLTISSTLTEEAFGIPSIHRKATEEQEEEEQEAQGGHHHDASCKQWQRREEDEVDKDNESEGCKSTGICMCLGVGICST
jgi:hypothetical protein